MNVVLLLLATQLSTLLQSVENKMTTASLQCLWIEEDLDKVLNVTRVYLNKTIRLFPRNFYAYYVLEIKMQEPKLRFPGRQCD